MALAKSDYVLTGDQIASFEAANESPAVIIPRDSELLGVYAHNTVLTDAACTFVIHKDSATATFLFRIPNATADESVAFYPLNGRIFFVAGEALSVVSGAEQTNPGNLHLSFLLRRI